PLRPDAPTYDIVSYNAPSYTEISPLSLHDALPIFLPRKSVEDIPVGHDPDLRAPLEQPHVLQRRDSFVHPPQDRRAQTLDPRLEDRKSTRLNSSHRTISYAVFCLKKKNNTQSPTPP